MKPVLTVLTCLALLAPVAAYAKASRDDAAATAQQMTGGRVLAVEKTEHGGKQAWRVKVVTPQGEVRFIVIDAETGKPV
jgi:uncharacterized membrane protein YkoI